MFFVGKYFIVFEGKEFIYAFSDDFYGENMFPFDDAFDIVEKGDTVRSSLSISLLRAKPFKIYLCNAFAVQIWNCVVSFEFIR